MINIFKNFKNYKLPVFLIVCLLVIQAFCDLALPDYMSEIIDIGITNGGIEHEMPINLSKDSYELLPIFMNEGEVQDFQNAYSYSESDGYYTLISTNKDEIEALDDEFAGIMALSYMFTSEGDEAAGSSMNMSDMELSMSDEEKMAVGQAVMQAFMTKQPGSLVMIRDLADEYLNAMGDSIISSLAKRFVKAEYVKCGADLDKIQTSYLWLTGGKMLLMALGVALLAVMIGYLASRVGAGVGRDLRAKVFRKVIGFSDAEMNKFSTASLITRSTNDVQQVQMVSVMLLRMVLYSPILAIGGIINVTHYKSGMGWIIVLAIAMVASLILALLMVAMPKFKAMQDKVDNVNLIAREILTGLPVIRAFSREKHEEERFDDVNDDLTRTMLFVNRAMAVMFPAMTMIMNGVSVLIVWTAAKKIDAGVIEVGAMTAFITYSMLIIMSFLMLTMISIILPRAGVAADRIKEVLDTKEVIKDKDDADDSPITDATLAFNNVSFKYPDGVENAISNVNFTARVGETTAIIGSTGCGKSTLVKLIPRFFDVTEGSITVGGKDIRDISLQSLRSVIGYVPQKGVLFSGDIRSNILFGAPYADEDTMLEAASIAQATEFIAQKEGEYDSFVSQGGTNVSGGQKQRLSIARAIARNPKIYIFDDSFSALDFKTDTLLRKALESKTKESVVLIVAQRVSTILNADRIIVLEDGVMIGNGTHKELVKTCESYDQIARAQLSEAEYERSIAD